MRNAATAFKYEIKVTWFPIASKNDTTDTRRLGGPQPKMPRNLWQTHHYYTVYPIWLLPQHQEHLDDSHSPFLIQMIYLTVSVHLHFLVEQKPCLVEADIGSMKETEQKTWTWYLKFCKEKTIADPLVWALYKTICVVKLTY